MHFETHFGAHHLNSMNYMITRRSFISHTLVFSTQERALSMVKGPGNHILPGRSDCRSGRTGDKSDLASASRRIIRGCRPDTPIISTKQKRGSSHL
jgi:hypothetical protein